MSETKTLNEEITKLKSDKEKTEEDYLALDATMISLNDLNVHMSKELEMLRNPDHQIFHLKSSHVISKDAKAIICWNKKDFSLQIAAESFPDKKQEEDYQLWVVMDGKTIDLGVLPQTINGNFTPLKVEVRNPEYFFITLENKGGNTSPTRDQMYLSGNL